MTQITVTRRSGEKQIVPATEGLSVMEILRDNGIDEVLALCGGFASCATCHIYVSSEFADRLPKMNEDEDDMLESAIDREETSRLSCQIPFSAELDGLEVKIGPGE